MGHSYTVRCLTCSPDPVTPGEVCLSKVEDSEVSIGPDNNRGWRLCWWLVENADKLATIAEIALTFSAETLYDYDCGKILLRDSLSEGKQIDLDWFRRHKGHSLVTVADYGERYTREDYNKSGKP